MRERRKEPRFKVRKGAFAVDWITPHRLGEIIDISLSGLSFRCIEGDNGFAKKTALGIFSSTHKIFLRDLPFQTLSDIGIPGHPTSTIAMRRQSGRFVALAAEQQEHLAHLIERLTQGPA